MYSFVLAGYVPSPGRIWTNYRIEEALSSDGPWTSIEEGPLSPLDINPNDPQERNFNVATNTIDGWYRVVFIDADSNFENTIPRWNHQSLQILYTPTVDQVGALLRARTKDDAGNELGTFTEDTRPTAVQVEELIRQAIDTIANKVGNKVPDQLIPETQRLVALRAAMLVEASYFPEQVATGRSIYPIYEKQWEAGYGTEKFTGTLIRAISEAKAQADGSLQAKDPGVPLYNFPASAGIGSRRL